MMTDRVYIARTGLITATGGTSDMVAAVFRTGISAYQRANYFTQDQHLMTLAQIPEESLPPLADPLNISTCSLRDQRLIRMLQLAVEQALQEYRGQPIPLLLAGPENYRGLNHQLGDNFLAHFAQQIDLPIDYPASRVNSLGRLASSRHCGWPTIISWSWVIPLSWSAGLIRHKTAPGWRCWTKTNE